MEKVLWLLTFPTLLKAQIDISLCGKSYGCVLVPSGCSSASACDSIISYQYNKTADIFHFELTTKHKWVGFGQKLLTDGGSDMENIRGVYCARTEPAASIGIFHGNDLSYPSRPTWLDNVVGVTEQSIVIKNGLITCRFEHAVVPPEASKMFLYNFKEKLWGIAAFGNRLDGKRPAKHSGYGKSQEPVDFFKISIIEATEGRKAKQAEIAHGICMVIAWVFFATIGIFMSRYMKPATKDKKILGKQAWFPIHVFSMVMCVIFFVIGLILILTKHSHIDTNNKHHMIGLFTVIFGLIQPVIALFRPAPDHEKRFIFNWIHRTIGMVAWLLAVCAIIFGLDFFSKSGVPMIVFLALVVVLFVLLDLIMCSTSNDEQSEKPDSDDMVNTELEVHVTSPKNKRNTISWIILIVMVGLVVCFTLYHIVIIAQLE